MSHWDFSDMGDFESEADADRWPKRNGVPHQDVCTRNTGRGVKLEVRRSALGEDGQRSSDLRDGRRTGF